MIDFEKFERAEIAKIMAEMDTKNRRWHAQLDKQVRMGDFSGAALTRESINRLTRVRRAYKQKYGK